MTQPIQPIFIMPEDTKRSTGKNAQRNNIMAARAISEAIRTTLGPKGMDKMIVDSSGYTTVTNDGVTILKEMNIEHPAAKMIVEIAKNQEKIVGDGTTSAVIIAGELLKKSEELLDLNIHPTLIAKGYNLANKESKKILESISKPINIDDDETLRNIAKTAMTGKGAESNKEHFANLIVKAIKTIAEKDKTKENSYLINKSNIKIETIIGEESEKSKLIKGIVLDKERVHPEMPTRIHNAKIALLNSPLEIRNTEIDAKIQITSPEQLNLFLEQEEKTLKNMVQKIIDTGCNVLICQKGVDEIAQHFLAKKNILTLRRVKKSDMELLAQATNAKIINNLKEITSEHLGSAGLVKEEKINDEEMIYVEQCPNPKALSIIIEGSTEHIIEEMKRAIEDAIGDLCATLKEGKIVAGAGSTETILSKRLLLYSQQLQGREQLAVKLFSEALDIIPITLAENSGIDPIDTLTKLKSSQLEWPGINVFTGEVMDAWQEGIIEPLKIKTQAINSASEVAEMILRIDDVIINSSNSEQTNHQQHYP